MFADVTSANVVGYMQKTMVQNFNYICPMFLSVGDNAVYLQDIQFDASTSVNDKGSNIQVLGTNRAMTEYYYWFKKITRETDADFGKVGPSGYRVVCPEGKQGVWFRAWFNDSGTPTNYAYYADKTFPQGACLQINAAANKKLMFKGQVSDATISYTCLQNFNYLGNPYATDLNIQNIQFDASTSVNDKGSNIQILGTNRAMTEYYYWFKKITRETDADFGKVGPSGYRVVCPEDKQGAWFQAWFNTSGSPTNYAYAVEKVIPSGSGFQINAAANKKIVITSPYSLAQ